MDALDDERLKQGKHFGKDYFDDLLERIREIRMWLMGRRTSRSVFSVILRSGCREAGNENDPRRAETMEETRTKLITAARKAFAEKGFAAASMDDLTASVGLTKCWMLRNKRADRGEM